MSAAEKLDIQAIWHYEINGERMGPISENRIVEMIKDNSLSGVNSVWKKGLDNWVDIQDCELKKYLDLTVPPPLTGDKVNNTTAWILAFAPIIGYILQYFIAGVLWGNAFALKVDSIWYVTLVLNIVLSIIDEQKLSKAGHSTNKLKGWVWLVPVYLFQRTKLLKQSVSYFVVWLVCFFLVLIS